VGSYLDARHCAGEWLVRIEDLDRDRVIGGCAHRILHTLEAFGLTWDGPVLYQSERGEYYRHALARLSSLGRTFECSCSRREHSAEAHYPGTCRAGPSRPGPTATRFRVGEQAVSFRDRVQGECRFDLAERGDVVIRRRDGAFAYQLAVVVDDALQGVTDVVRGADLIDSTPWQVALQQALGLPPVRYAHLPLITEPTGAKLAKSRRSVPLDARQAGAQLHEALGLLGLSPPAELKFEVPKVLIAWARPRWTIESLKGIESVPAPD
jgi:glutamyl-Q tRNA(Asp) synthetase